MPARKGTLIWHVACHRVFPLPTQVMRNIVPVIMAGILGIYGLIVAAILVGKIQVRAA